MSNARQKTLTRMRALVAASTAAFASLNCNDGCGYTTVDPLPGPGPTTTGFCGTIATSFKVGARRAVDRPRPPSDDGQDAALDAALDAGPDAAEADAGDVEDAGQPPPDAGGAPKQDLIFFALEARSGAGSGISLKRATITAVQGKLVGVRQSELLAEVDIDAANVLGNVILDVMLDSRCGGSSGVVLRFTLRVDGSIIDISGQDRTFSDNSEESLPNEL